MDMAPMDGERIDVELTDGFWAPRVAQLQDHTLAVLLDRFVEHGVVDAFGRLTGQVQAPRRGLWFTDSDLYKWMEAAALAGRLDLLDPVIGTVVAAQHPDGYLHTYYGLEPFELAPGSGGEPGRYRDLTSSHELYCFGHFIEAAVAHHGVTGRDDLLAPATRLADHVCATFGPDRDSRIDDHPEIELAMARLAAVTGAERYLAFARWSIEALLARAGLTIDTLDLAGHAVKALYLASGIAEVARATGDDRWRATTERLWSSLVHERSYPTGAVGGRWLGEAMGRPFELGDETAYGESCAAVAAVHFARRVHDLTGDIGCLDHLELVLYNAVACGVGADGESWFYSQPQAWHGPAEQAEQNPWVQFHEYHESMQLQWFPPRRHRWFDVTCCPPNLARMFAAVPQHVAAVEGDGSLRIDLPVAARIGGGGWDVRVSSDYPGAGAVTMRVEHVPDGADAARVIRVRVPGGPGAIGRWQTVEGRPGMDVALDVPVARTRHACDPRVVTAIGRHYVREGPIVLCAEVPTASTTDLRLLADADLEHEQVALIPYHQWANAGPSRMTVLLRSRTAEEGA
jgi:uncharacterized protein